MPYLRCGILWTLIVSSLALTAGGCSPLRVSFDIGFAPAPGLVERTILADGAGRSAPKVAMIPVTGLLADARSPGFLGAGSNPVDEFVKRLQAAENDPNVRAVILRINSPGGTVTGADIMYRELRGFAERSGKPVIASMGEIATSGGYYLALGADSIMAEATSVTGSIGVILQTVNISGGLAKIGVQARAVTSGPNKDMGNPLEPMQESHYDLLQSMVDTYSARFHDLVRERRPDLSDEDARWATDGRVVTGAEAAEIGLIDATGGVREAFALAKEMANLNSARLIAYTGPNRDASTPYGVRAPIETTAPGDGIEFNFMQLNLPSDLNLLLGSAGFYYLWRP